MTRSKLSHTQGQIAIRLDALPEDLHMARAIHWFQRQGALIFRLRGEHIFTEFFPMARRLPQRSVNQLWCFHFAVTRCVKPAPNIGFDFAIEHPAFCMPENRPRRLFLQMKQPQLFAKFPVIPLFRLFQHCQIGSEVLFAGPGCAINTL